MLFFPFPLFNFKVKNMKFGFRDCLILNKSVRTCQRRRVALVHINCDYVNNVFTKLYVINRIGSWVLTILWVCKHSWGDSWLIRTPAYEGTWKVTPGAARRQAKKHNRAGPKVMGARVHGIKYRCEIMYCQLVAETGDWRLETGDRRVDRYAWIECYLH